MRQFHSSNPEGLCDRCRQPIGQHISSDYFCPYYLTLDSDLTAGERLLNRELAKRTAERDELMRALEAVTYVRLDHVRALARRVLAKLARESP